MLSLRFVLALALVVLFASEAEAGRRVRSNETMVLGVFTEKCYDLYVNKQDFLDIPCLKKTVSKCLSYGIIAGSFLLKIPQMYKIVSAGSVKGLSPSSFYLEALSFTVNAAYNLLQNNPIDTFAELLIILGQNLFLVLLLWKYMSPSPSMFYCASVTVFYAALVQALAYVPAEYQASLIIVATVCSMSSRVPQIAQNFSNGHTGVLSIVTLILNLAGSVARMFTTFQEVGDLVLVAQYGIAATLNVTLVLQVLFYWTATKKALTKSKVKKTN